MPAKKRPAKPRELNGHDEQLWKLIEYVDDRIGECHSSIGTVHRRVDGVHKMIVGLAMTQAAAILALAFALAKGGI